MADKIHNPWSAKKWEEFLYFCCPECPEKYQSKELFIDHALNIHPNSQACLETIQIEVKYEEKETEGRKVGIKSSKTFKVLSRPKRNKPNPKYLDDYEYETNTKSQDPLSLDDPNNSNDEKNNIYQPEIKIEDHLEELIENDVISNDETETDEKTLHKAVVSKSKRKVKSNDFPNELLKCDSCEKKFKLKSSLVRHKRQRCGKENIKENVQEKKEDKTCTNIVVHEGEPHYICNICGKYFKVKHSYRNLRRHIEMVHEGKKSISQCTICGNTFRSSGYLKIHMRAIHDKIRQWKCEHCPMDFAHKQSWIDHVAHIHNGVNWICDLCNGSFTLERHLKRHRHQKHEDTINSLSENQGTTFPCKVCQKVLNSKELLKFHLIIHHKASKEEVDNFPNELLECDSCDKKFSFKSKLTRHKEAAHGEKSRHICYLCGKASSNSNNLKHHIKTVHEERSKVTCPTCGKLFGTAFHMKLHIKRIHEGIRKDHICEQCGKSFSEAKTLREHLAAIHSIGITHNCPKCGKSFGSKFNLKVHISGVHEGKRYECDYCNPVKSFTQTQDLKKHYRKVHPDEKYSPKQPTLINS